MLFNFEIKVIIQILISYCLSIKYKFYLYSWISYFQTCINYKYYFTGGTISATQEQDFDNDNLRKNTYGLTGGVDFNINNFVLGVRSAWDVKNNDGDGNSTTSRYKNMLYQATLGYRF
jgi:hypothetical protein